ncbi:hypothetical protein PFISCL1PPCAC_1655, partial [Pristionchus fissidentatus]
KISMLTFYEVAYIGEILIVIISLTVLGIFPVIIIRTRAISRHFRFLLLLLWLSHFLLVGGQLTSIVMRWAYADIELCCMPWEAFQIFRLIHDVGFYMTTTAMFLLIYDRLLFTILYKHAEKREKYFRQMRIVAVPLGIVIACLWTYRADVDFAIAEACLIAHSCDAISCVFCALTYFLTKRKYRDSFTQTTLDTRYLLFESQELTFALLPVCVMAVILKNLSLITIWMYALDPTVPHAMVLLVFYSVNTVNVFLSQFLFIRMHRLLWKRFKKDHVCVIYTAHLYKKKKFQYATYFVMLDKQLMFTIYDGAFIGEILIVLISLCILSIFPLIILRTGAISVHFRFLLLLFWLSHFLLVISHAISIIMRWAWQDIPMCCLPWDAFQTFRLIHDVGFYMTTTAMFLLIYDRFLFTIFYKHAERRQKYFSRVMVITVPAGV